MRSRILVLSAAIIALSLFALSSSGTYSHLVSATQQILFQDDYSSSAGWTQLGTQVTVNSIAHPGVAYFDNVAGGGTVNDERVFKHLPSMLPVRWTADYDYKFTASSDPDFHPFELTATSANPQDQAHANQVEVRHGPGLNELHVLNATDQSSGIPILPNVQYYVRVDKTPTLITLSVFLDPARTVQAPGSPVTISILATDHNNLNFIQHDGCRDCGSSRTLTAQIDNTIIYTQTAVCPTDEHGENEDNGETATQEFQEDQGEQGEQNEQGNEDCNGQ